MAPLLMAVGLTVTLPGVTAGWCTDAALLMALALIVSPLVPSSHPRARGRHPNERS